MAKDNDETRVLRELEDAGAVIDEIIRKKHVKIKWRLRGHRRTTIVAATASDHRSSLNARAQVRRQIREVQNA